jgi:hypothetical protein
MVGLDLRQPDFIGQGKSYGTKPRGCRMSRIDILMAGYRMFS